MIVIFKENDLILKEAEEIIDNYIKKQSEFSYKFNVGLLGLERPRKRKIPTVMYITGAALAAGSWIIYTILR